MKKIIYSTMALVAISIQTSAQNQELAHVEGKDPLAKTFIANIKQRPDADFQHLLREQEAWKQFHKNASQWQVVFNEANQLPHRASGPGIKVPAFASEQQLLSYVGNTLLSDYQLPINELVIQSKTENNKHLFYHFKQIHNGKEVLNSDLYLKLSHQNDLIVFGLDVYKNIPALDATISLAAAKTIAGRDVKGLFNVEGQSITKILPVPTFRSVEYHVVYEVIAEGIDEEQIPSKYYTLVDANNGAILYRANQIHHHASESSSQSLPIPGKITATYYKLNSYQGSSVGSLGYVRLTVNGQTYFADSAGVFNLPISDPSVSAILSLEGQFSNTRVNGGVAPSFGVTLTQSQNNITFAAPATIEHLSAYNATNRIHDYMKTKFPTFTTLDISMPTNINITSGNCNAFYNGSSINFFAPGNGCAATANVADVVYHEYGHGINGQYYSTFNGSFNNGGMNEGYADVWAIGLTENPVLGIGFFTNNSTGFVRRYDVNKKVYPSDLVGEVHADGEIIAGSWWDYGLEINNVQSMMDLFKSTYPALITAPNGQEGQLYADILLEAITEDDNDNNIANGTPHFCQLIKAFGIHGIELYGSLNITNSIVSNSPTATSVLANISNTNLGPKNIKAFYSTAGNTFTQVIPTYTTGQLSFNITPAVANGKILKYYFTSQDTCPGSNTVNYFPSNADHNAQYPNLSYMDLIGYNLIEKDDFDTTFNYWDFFSGGTAQTGVWDIDFPEGSFADPVAKTGMVQTDNDHTTISKLNGKCAITGNAPAGSAVGVNDIDGGKTILTSKIYDVSGLIDPVFSYWRWYTNDQGATPKTDFWKVEVSNDFSTWIPVENTLTPDHSWRRNIFKLSDYLNLSNGTLIQIRFIGEDANAGSLVEAAVDDVELYAIGNPSAIENLKLDRAISVYPNPTKDKVNITLNNDLKMSTVKITDQLGREIKNIAVNQLSQTTISTSDLKKGLYFVSVVTDKKVFEQKIIVQ
jgi:Zn-dependent metalloprotease